MNKLDEGYAYRYCIYAKFSSEKFPKGRTFWFALPCWGNGDDGRLITCFWGYTNTMFKTGQYKTLELAEKRLNKLTPDNFKIEWRDPDDKYCSQGFADGEFGTPKFEEYGIAKMGVLRGSAKTLEVMPFGMTIPGETIEENTKMNKEQLFESILNETQIEVFPQDGKLQARGIGDKVVSSKTHNKMSGLDTQTTTLPLGRNQLAGTKAVIAYLKSKNKLNDIANEFDTDPRPDITFNPTGDAVITPDGGNGKPYTIPAAEIEPFYEAVEKEEKNKLFENILRESEQEDAWELGYEQYEPDWDVNKHNPYSSPSLRAQYEEGWNAAKKDNEGYF